MLARHAGRAEISAYLNMETPNDHNAGIIEGGPVSLASHVRSLSQLIIPFDLDLRLIVQDDAQQRAVDDHIAVVLDEAQLPKLVHEKADPRPRGADQVRQRLLADFRNDRLRPPFLAEIRPQDIGLGP